METGFLRPTQTKSGGKQRTSVVPSIRFPRLTSGFSTRQNHQMCAAGSRLIRSSFISSSRTKVRADVSPDCVVYASVALKSVVSSRFQLDSKLSSLTVKRTFEHMRPVWESLNWPSSHTHTVQSGSDEVFGLFWKLPDPDPTGKVTDSQTTFLYYIKTNCNREKVWHLLCVFSARRSACGFLFLLLFWAVFK